mmetsp:Transcript_139084/g.444209  ORF Transcript_139084/g.444209 Transcript_139084/m.444209 type:complete len:668 (-) Transcript_139084:236-2239(-)
MWFQSSSLSRSLEVYQPEDRGGNVQEEAEDDEDEDGSLEETEELVSSLDNEVIRRLKEQKNWLATSEAELLGQMELFDGDRSSIRKPLEEALSNVQGQRMQVKQDMEAAKRAKEGIPDPPGPKELSWADSTWFHAICNIAVAGNLLAMALAPSMQDHAAEFKAADQVFLTWYVFELGVKTLYFQQHLYLGPLSRVWWNWLDLGIVVSGIVDQWLIPLLVGSGGAHFHASALRSLRMLRLFRLLRVLKLLRAFSEDMSWADSPEFELFMSCVIAVNSVVMALELDVPWAGWQWIEHLFLIIYLSELLVRLKREGRYFFCDCSKLFWNYLDTTIVIGGIIDMWLMPGVALFKREVLSEDVDTERSSSSASLSLLRLMRLMRVLRLARLVRTIPPLYRLLQGVVQALHAMQWVMVLTLLILYAGAILWTTVVSAGFLWPEDQIPEDVQKRFGSVVHSLFSLFRLMNGETDVAATVTQTAFGQVLFIGFMIITNWAMLAILTSVVSSNMFESSAQTEKEEFQANLVIEHAEKNELLGMLFQNIDTDRSGALREDEWRAIMHDKGTLNALFETTGMTARNLDDLFRYLAVDSEWLLRHPDIDNLTLSPRFGRSGKVLKYSTLMDHVRVDADALTRREVLKIMSWMVSFENKLDTTLDDIVFFIRGLLANARF